ncbi:MAG TPA: LysR substrate-binding domain-containing protein [Nannocystis sp.]|jgi:DNA-binding transcriptional LysR family regulator
MTSSTSPLSGPAIAATCDVTATNDAGASASPNFDFHHVSVRELIPTFAAYALHVSPLFVQADPLTGLRHREGERLRDQQRELTVQRRLLLHHEHTALIVLIVLIVHQHQALLWDQIPPSGLCRHDAVDRTLTSDHEWLIAGPLARVAGLPKDLEPRISANDFLFLREAACAGAGVAMLPAFMAGPKIAAGELVRVLENTRIDAGGLALVYSAGRNPARKVIAFRDFLIATIKKDWLE